MNKVVELLLSNKNEIETMCYIKDEFFSLNDFICSISTLIKKTKKPEKELQQPNFDIQTQTIALADAANS
jgi:hypothetical protein